MKVDALLHKVSA